MKIILNGKEENIKESTTTLELIESKGLNPNKVIVELNGEILQTESPLNNGDKVELIHMVGGG